VDKSAIVVFGEKHEGERWTMGGKEVVVVHHYCYLGVKVKQAGGWASKREEQISKARRSMWRA
jgi:hypothetical protein